jgi:hypothetical protein
MKNQPHRITVKSPIPRTGANPRRFLVDFSYRFYILFLRDAPATSVDFARATAALPLGRWTCVQVFQEEAEAH